MRLPPSLAKLVSEPDSGRKHIVVTPGSYHISNANVIISTLLGSCVAACLYDPVRKVMGMNHFLLSVNPGDKTKSFSISTSEAGRYGVHAMELLINRMLKRGARRRNLRAKVFGGGNVLQIDTGNSKITNVAECNCAFIKEFLKADGIPLIAANLGGNFGRVIHFYYGDFSVYVRKIKKIYNQDLVQLDRGVWQETLKEQKSKKSKPELWL
ncbi:MAG: chemotaxis protein CheD [Deltaproteobacteria bacterium]|nr:chemotaxis protein CheD [Deltaproteobacteria bacterium]